ncbi:MAG: biotin carboxyl carrier domain-containing protein [Rhizobiales bacterium]|nr:biotin carboxyl carrier domain-containing protein [Hyphomicrobiales bacterium]
MTILSPLPGTFYSRPSPDEPAFKKAGDTVEIDDTIGLIEVMKTFIEVKSEVAGTFKAYVVENSSPVDPGAILAELE